MLPVTNHHFKQQFMCHRMGSDRLGLIVHKLAEREVCAIGLKVDRTVPKHSNESAF